MALTTYANLVTAVSNWTHRYDLSSYAADLITLGEDRINLEVRAREMETALSVTISSGVAAVPSDFTALKYAYIDGSPVRKLKTRAAEWVIEAYPERTAASKPQYIAVDGSNFIFGPYPDSSGYTVAGTYYKRMPALSGTLHALYTRMPSLYLFAALSEANAFIAKDARILVWEAKYAAIRDRLNSTKTEGDFSGGGLAVTTDFSTT